LYFQGRVSGVGTVQRARPVGQRAWEGKKKRRKWGVQKTNLEDEHTNRGDPKPTGVVSIDGGSRGKKKRKREALGGAGTAHQEDKLVSKSQTSQH